MSEENICKGTIAGISGHPMSGLWNLHFEDGSFVFIESGFGVRQLSNCFGAREGSGDLLSKIKGKTIYYSKDAFNVFGGFTPEEEATPELIELHKKQGGKP